MNLKGAIFTFGAAAALLMSSHAAEIAGTVVFPIDVGKNASITLVDAAQATFTAKLAQDGEFRFAGVAEGDAAITLKVARQVFEIRKMWVDAGRNEVTLYFPADMKVDVRNAGSEASHERGSQLLQAGAYAEAISQFTIALTHDTAQSPTWASMALSYVGLRRLEDAVFCGKMAIRFDPSESSYWNNLGSTYYRMNRFTEAVAMYEKAATLNPAGAGLYLSNAGAALFAMDQDSRAISSYERAVQVAGCPPGSWFHLGALLARNGENARAAAALRQYLDRQPTGQYADNAKRLLSQVAG